MAALFFDLETLGEDLDALLRSKFAQTVLGDVAARPSKDVLEQCLGQERTARVKVALHSLSKEKRRRARRSEPADDGDLPQNHHDDGELPSTADLVETIESDAPTKVLLEAMYGMDLACMAPKAA